MKVYLKDHEKYRNSILAKVYSPSAILEAPECNIYKKWQATRALNCVT